MMPKVEILEESNNSLPAPVSPHAIAPSPTLTLELEDGGEAIFRIPTVKDLRAIERADQQTKERRSLSDTCRELGKACLMTWDGSGEMPGEDDIFAYDDQALVRLFLKELAGNPDGDLSDTELMELYSGAIAPTQDYEVLDNKNHRVQLSLGSITFRRLTRKDIRRIEANADKTGAISGDVMTAVSVCEEWWGGRSIMPADFDPIPLREFRRVSAALNGFLQRSANPQRRGFS